MKLELKHLAPYLPYGIPAKLSRKGIFNQDDEYPNPRVLELGIIKNISFWHPEITGQLHLSETYSFDFDEIDEVDIVLRPMYELSDYFLELYGSLEHQDVTDYFDEDYLESFNNLEIHEIASTRPEYLPYGTLQVLFKHHFDVFGLIEKGLAIDINTLNK